MTGPHIETSSTQQLVQQFLSYALLQDAAERRENVFEYNRLYQGMEAVERELKSRSGDQRQALIPLCHHPNVQVRLAAAFAILAIEPNLARQTLEKISRGREYPQAADARGMLNDLDEGRYVPT